MRIQYISDLHLELLRSNQVKTLISKIIPAENVDVLCLCGDLGNPFQYHYTDLISHVSSKFPQTFVIAGNHEFYSNKIGTTKHQLEKVISNYPNVTYLDNSTYMYRDHKFIGSILWSHISNPNYKINDTKAIKDLTVDLYNDMHRHAKEFIKKELEECKETQCPAVVLTHHVPLFELTASKYRVPMLEPYHQWFSANMNDIVGSNKDIIKGWFYGHTHTGSSIKMHDVGFYTNPIGYEFENDVNSFITYVDV